MKNKINELNNIINNKADKKLKEKLYKCFLPNTKWDNFSNDVENVCLMTESIINKRDISIKNLLLLIIDALFIYNQINYRKEERELFLKKINY